MKLTFVFMLLAGALTLGVNAAYADDGGPAIVIPDGICLIGDPANPPFVVALRNAHITESANPDGNFSMHCMGENPNPPGDTNVVVDGATTPFVCVGISAGNIEFITTDWHGVITKSGRINISCHFNPAS